MVDWEPIVISEGWQPSKRIAKPVKNLCQIAVNFFYRDINIGFELFE